MAVKDSTGDFQAVSKLIAEAPAGFEVYSGTHTSRVADRVQNHVLPFFSRTLCVTAACQ